MKRRQAPLDVGGQQDLLLAEDVEGVVFARIEKEQDHKPAITNLEFSASLGLTLMLVQGTLEQVGGRLELLN